MKEISKKFLKYRKTKNEKLFNEIYYELSPKIYYFILRYVKKSSISFELTLKTMGILYEKMNDYNPQYELTTWIFNIAKRECNKILYENQLEINVDKFQDNCIVMNGDEEFSNLLDGELLNKIRSYNYVKTSNINPFPFYNDNLYLSNKELIFRYFFNKIYEEINNLPVDCKNIFHDYIFKNLKYSHIAIKYNLPLQTIKNKIIKSREILNKKIENKNEFYQSIKRKN